MADVPLYRYIALKKRKERQDKTNAYIISVLSTAVLALITIIAIS